VADVVLHQLRESWTLPGHCCRAQWVRWLMNMDDEQRMAARYGIRPERVREAV
jgi:hypothetical protein